MYLLSDECSLYDQMSVVCTASIVVCISVVNVSVECTSYQLSVACIS